MNKNPTTTSISPLTGKAIARKGAVSAEPRRTQSERVAETRARILAATTTYIDEHGFHQTSLQKVAQAAGVTVGAVQHHFASKSDLLAAVLEAGFENLSFDMEQALMEGAAMTERISAFVDLSWKHCNSPQFQSNLHILLCMRKEDTENFEHWINETLGHVVQKGFSLWLRMFNKVNGCEVTLSEEEHFNIMLYCFSSLSGIALLSRISQAQERVDSDLGELKKLLHLRFSEKRFT
jgi:AcrR family transcriptional regulator